MPTLEWLNPEIGFAPLHALARLCTLASGATGQSRRVADFLLAWHNAPENGQWDPTDLWSVDHEIAQDMLVVLRLVLESRRYPADLGFKPEIERVWQTWRSSRPNSAPFPTPLPPVRSGKE